MKTLLPIVLAPLAFARVAKADPVELSTYADANGFIDVQKLTCAQLANTYQEDANALASCYSGWYNGLAHKHFMDVKKGRESEHLVIQHCTDHPDGEVIHAISVVFKTERAEGMAKDNWRIEGSAAMTMKVFGKALGAALTLAAGAGVAPALAGEVTFLCDAPTGHTCKFQIRTARGPIAFALPAHEHALPRDCIVAAGRG